MTNFKKSLIAATLSSIISLNAHAINIDEAIVKSESGQKLEAQIDIDHLGDNPLYGKVKANNFIGLIKADISKTSRGSRITISSDTAVRDSIALSLELTDGVERFDEDVYLETTDGTYTTKTISPAQQRRVYKEEIVVVKRGDTLGGIAAKYKNSNLSFYKRINAIFENNKDSFIDGDIEKLKEGARLVIPPTLHNNFTVDQGIVSIPQNNIVALPERKLNAEHAKSKVIINESNPAITVLRKDINDLSVRMNALHDSNKELNLRVGNIENIVSELSTNLKTLLKRIGKEEGATNE